jgi:uncharacterized Tic20 family protein
MPEQTANQATTTPELNHATHAEQKQVAMLSWALAPIYSYVVKDSASDFVRSHAQASFYYGIASIIVFVVAIIFEAILGALVGLLFSNPFTFAWVYSLVSCFNTLFWLLILGVMFIPRLFGVLQANTMQKWEVPYLRSYLEKYIRL